MLLLERALGKIEIVMKLTTEQKTILRYLASAEKWISQKNISMFKKAQSNVSDIILSH